MPVANPQRVLVLADTGCRLQKSSNTYQPCTDPAAWPLPGLAKTAAALKLDLVLHIGDYHYRENACPADIAGCAASPWGYGWDVWRADLLDPAAPPLAAATWVVVRGNHEECARAGQGWYRLLDTAAYAAARSCDAALISNTGVNSIFVNHHPILGFAPLKGALPANGNAVLQSVLAGSYPTSYLPTGVQLVLHGHVHDFQATNSPRRHRRRSFRALAATTSTATCPIRFQPTSTPRRHQDDDATAPEPRGGLFADGRHDRIADAIAAPLLHPDEMNDRDPRAFAATPHAAELRRLLGARMLDDPAGSMRATGLAIEAYLQSESMAPVSSRYDAFIRGQGGLTPLESHGMRLFANRTRATVRPATSLRRARRTRHDRFSPTTVTTRSRCRATERLPSTGIRCTSTSACAASPRQSQ